MDIYFAQIREDSRVERELVQHRNPARIAVIGSGGCTAFSVLTDTADTVFCIDLNPAQCALVELKKAAISALDRSSFLAFIGEAESGSRLAVYQQISGTLAVYAKEYWDARPEQIEAGINKCGVTERFYDHISRNILENIYPEEVWAALFRCQTLADQQHLFNRYFRGGKWHSEMLVLLSKTSHLQFFPAFMFAQAQENDFGQFFLHQFEKELQQKLVKDNYFLSQFLFGKYLAHEPEGMPFYLTEQGYSQTKRNLRKLKIIPDSLTEVLEKESGIDAFFLSNIFDWAAEETRQQICTSILESAAERALVLYRNMLSEPQMPASFAAQFRVDNDLSERSHTRERSMLYRKITVGELR